MTYRSALQPAGMTGGVEDIGTTFSYSGTRNIPDYVVRSGTTYRVITDNLGSLRMVVDSTNGTVVQKMNHDAWGVVTLDWAAPGWVKIPFGFAGGIYDPTTKLVRFGARDYDPETGTWMGRDPIRFEGGQENLWVYAGDDPVNANDPSGRSACDICMSAYYTAWSQCSMNCFGNKSCLGFCEYLVHPLSDPCSELCEPPTPDSDSDSNDPPGLCLVPESPFSDADSRGVCETPNPWCE